MRFQTNEQIQCSGKNHAGCHEVLLLGAELCLQTSQVSKLQSSCIFTFWWGNAHSRWRLKKQHQQDGIMPVPPRLDEWEVQSRNRHNKMVAVAGSPEQGQLAAAGCALPEQGQLAVAGHVPPEQWQVAAAGHALPEQWRMAAKGRALPEQWWVAATARAPPEQWREAKRVENTFECSTVFTPKTSHLALFGGILD